MRTITVTICFRPEDEAFDRLTDEALIDTIKNGLLRAYPLMRSSELDVRSGPMVDSGGLPEHISQALNEGDGVYRP